MAMLIDLGNISTEGVDSTDMSFSGVTASQRAINNDYDGTTDMSNLNITELHNNYSTCMCNDGE